MDCGYKQCKLPAKAHWHAHIRPCALRNISVLRFTADFCADRARNRDGMRRRRNAIDVRVRSWNGTTRFIWAAYFMESCKCDFLWQYVAERNGTTRWFAPLLSVAFTYCHTVPQKATLLPTKLDINVFYWTKLAETRQITKIMLQGRFCFIRAVTTASFYL